MKGFRLINMENYEKEDIKDQGADKRDYVIKDIRVTREERRKKSSALIKLKILKHRKEFKSGMVVTSRKERNSNKGFMKEWVIQFAVAIILALAINMFLIFRVYIPSESMVPTLNVGDRLFVTKVYNRGALERGDILVFNSEEEEVPLIKRLIGLPGDNISIKNGIVSINGIVMEEDYIGERDNFTGTYNVPEGHYFFLGDNRYYSKDSRYFEDPFIASEEIIGKAQLKIYPFSDIGVVK